MHSKNPCRIPIEGHPFGFLHGVNLLSFDRSDMMLIQSRVERRMLKDLRVNFEKFSRSRGVAWSSEQGVTVYSTFPRARIGNR